MIFTGIHLFTEGMFTALSHAHRLYGTNAGTARARIGFRGKSGCEARIRSCEERRGDRVHRSVGARNAIPYDMIHTIRIVLVLIWGSDG